MAVAAKAARAFISVSDRNMKRKNKKQAEDGLEYFVRKNHRLNLKNLYT